MTNTKIHRQTCSRLWISYYALYEYDFVVDIVKTQRHCQLSVGTC